MKIWAVHGDDHYYDIMSQWTVGVFSTPEKAAEAIDADRKAYKGHLKKRGGPNYEIVECEIDERIKDD